MFIGNLLDDRQAQARALGLGGDVGLERALDDLFWEARPVVAHGQAHRAHLAAVTTKRALEAALARCQ